MMNFDKKTILDVDLRGKKVLLRCDFNIPLDKDTGEITDDGRIMSALPTINYILDQGAAVIACSHLGRPKGVWMDELSMRAVAVQLSKRLGCPVKMSKDIVGPDAKKIASKLKPGEIMMLENLRFDPREEQNDDEFACELASMADLYVSDAFGSVHRTHASMSAVAKFIPAVSGFLLEKEMAQIGGAVQNPKRPLVAVIGGSKISDKLGVIVNLIDTADVLIVGGGMAYTFIKSQGGRIGDSLCEDDKISSTRDMIRRAMQTGTKILLPYDSVVAEGIDSEDTQILPSDEIPDGLMGLDIGPKAAEEYAKTLRGAGTVIWNGPMGVFEKEQFSQGTRTVAEALAKSNAVSIVGGGDSAAAIRKFGLQEHVTHVSTGGGATLEFLQGRALPGIVCLIDKRSADEDEHKKIVIAGNWKMNEPDPAQFDSELISPMPESVTAIICPPFPFLSEASKMLNVSTGAQNVSKHASGAYTGEVSAEQLLRVGVKYVIIGHSERRQYHGETDEIVNDKVKTALDNGLIPIICVGETLEQRKNGETDIVNATQVTTAFTGVSGERAKRCIVAYEPRWAIGSGVAASGNNAQSACRFIREKLGEIYGENTAKEIPILYGGSMSAFNAAELLQKPDIDGGLIGSASLDAAEFSEIIGIAAAIAGEK
ncbi:MAG: triose-phosphate isomerase [Clostridiales bacterium]|nr:triose-phosphate isomerase [Clostridiales bacterium]